MYGMGADGLAKRLSIQKHEAQTLMNDYFNQFPKVRGLSRYPKSAWDPRWLDRKREWSDPQRRPKRPQNHPSRSKYANPRKQRGHYKTGTRKDPSCLAHQAGLDAHLAHTVHDEILVEGNRGDAEQLGELVRRAMEEAGAQWIHAISMKADVSVGDVWAK